MGLKQGVSSWKVHRHEEDLLDVFPRDSLVYLSPDATHVLQVSGLGLNNEDDATGEGDGVRVWLTHLSSRCWQDIDHSKVYVIGGIVGKSGFISLGYKVCRFNH